MNSTSRGHLCPCPDEVQALCQLIGVYRQHVEKSNTACQLTAALRRLQNNFNHTVCAITVMSGSAPDRKAIEELWLNRLHDVALRLDFARSYVKELQRDSSSADGRYLHQRALHAENSALKKYERVLRIFSDLTVYGKIPNESDWPRCEPASEDEGD